MSIFTSSIWNFVFGYRRHFPNKTLLNKMINVEETCMFLFLFEALYRIQSTDVFFKHKTEPLNITNSLILMGNVVLTLCLKLGNVVNHNAGSLISRSYLHEK